MRTTISTAGRLAVVVAIVFTAGSLPLRASATQPTPGAAEAAAAQQAAAAKDCPAALDHFEAALRADADNLRYGSDYRKSVIACAAYDRAIAFFGKLTDEHPGAANALLNYGYAYVDKIPAAGAITQVILANSALTLFGKSLDLQESWLGLYTRGNSYLYWPKVFGRTPLGVADLEKAVARGDAEGNRPYHVRAWIALGDGYWKLDQLDKARATWQEGLRRFPGEPRLQARLDKQGEELTALIEGSMDPAKRVDTDLAVLWAPQ
ncbi:MAG TPA: tetratricopeptide repeat protein [Thermoanaerobaculia bacterium]|jgi:tetratricopeptide (TPR) repeat protein|nr:tetratricopeptide repeat protein [Thermoanaerobaculia bacterium]